MPITLITGPANAGKAQLVLESVRRHLAHGGEPRLVVPTQADTEHYLRELAGERAAMGVRVERFKDLLAEICARSGTGARALGELSREQIVASIARELGATGTAGPLARTGLVRALCTLFADLEVRRATPARFAAALRAGLGDEHATAVGLDLAGLYGAYERALARVERPDEERSAMAALDALRERPALWRGTPVLFYGFDDLARLQLDAIETLGTVVDADVTVSLAFEPGRVAFAGRAATFHALAPLAREHRELAPRSEHYAPASRAALSHLERCVFEPAQRRMPAGGKVRLLRGGAQRDELELVARNVRELLDSGLEAHEVAVVLRDPARSAELVRELFTAAGVPFALERRRPFADTSVGRGLVGLLRCVPGPTGATDGSTADLLAWLRCPGAIREQALVDSLEATCRRQGITDATRARAAWEAQRWPLDPLTALAEAQGRGPGALLERVGNELGRLFSRPRERQARVLDPEEVDEARALAAGHAALAELRELARIAPGATPARAAELADVLARVELYSGERPAPGAVAVLDPLSLRARRVRALFVAGLQEGEFPRRARPEPLLAEDERRHVAEASGLLLGGAQDVLDAERYLFYAVLSRPEELLFLSWHDADDDGEPVSRSLFVDDVCDLFTDELERDADRLARAEPGLLPTPAVARERDA
ncbi:MAG TPA: hypothetical protein VFW29_10650, partial [Solirubrobacteraceae bacterium]|nr:hypothetical protein [Solirubrobacteraceae bacterium]